MPVFRLKRGFEVALTPDVKANRADPALGPYEEVLDEYRSLDLSSMKGLLDHAVANGRDDAWLAPRFHFMTRIPRRLAGDDGMWSWLLMKVGRDYTWHRWASSSGDVTLYRYNGGYSRNALARLWWFAEMARNGDDYGPVSDVLRDASTAQYAMELRYSRYRPAVIAFGRVAANLRLGFDALKGLSRKINAYLSLRSLEGLGLSEDDGSRDQEWWNDEPTLAEALSTDGVLGPNDGIVDEQAVADLTRWFETLAQEHLAA